jgi:hypothetical protein
MSEKTEIPPLHIGAFVLAMVGGPILFTVVTIWAYFIPAFALLFGGLPYLAIGTPMALWMALTGPVTVERSLQWSGLTILFLTAACILFVVVTGSSDDGPAVLAMGGISAVFGMAWAGTTGWLYAAMTKEKAV